VVEHASLRRSRRAGCVDERGEVVLPDRLWLVLAGARPELGELVEADDRPLEDGGDLLVLLVILDEREDGLGVVEDVVALGCAVRRVEADDDGADRHDRPVEQDPLQAGARHHCHGVAALHPAGEEGAGEGVDAGACLLPRHLEPAVRPLLEVGRPRVPLLEHVTPEGGSGTGFQRQEGHGRQKEMGVPTRIRFIP